MSFQYQIIDSSRFRKYKRVRYGLYFSLILLGFLIIDISNKYRRNGGPSSIAHMLGLDIITLLIAAIIIGVTAFFLHFYSVSFDKLGLIEIDTQQIVVNKNGRKQTFEIGKIENLIFHRGSTWQYAYKEDNYLVTFNNWVKFSNDGVFTAIEFSLLTKEENNQFEKMVLHFRDKQVAFQYFTI